MQVFLGEYLRHQSHAFVDMGDVTIASDDPGALLSPVLQRVEGKKRQPGDLCIWGVDAKDAARFAKLIGKYAILHFFQAPPI
jgi:hypothetical protein